MNLVRRRLVLVQQLQPATAGKRTIALDIHAHTDTKCSDFPCVGILYKCSFRPSSDNIWLKHPVTAGSGGFGRHFDRHWGVGIFYK